MRISRRDALTGATAAAAVAAIPMTAHAVTRCDHVQAGDPVVALVGQGVATSGIG